MHGVAKVPARRAPEIGEHNEEFLTELGFDAKQIEGLRASGAIPHVATLDATTVREVNNE